MTEVVAWEPQEGPQLYAIENPWVEEMLYGGAVGGGKTDFLLGDFAQDVPTEHGCFWKGILFRKTYPQLQDIIARAYDLYPKWFPGVRDTDGGTTWIWPNGAELRLRHMENDKAWSEYQGHAYTWIGFDELGEWANPTNYLKMFARLRSAYNVPNKRIRATANPGGVGHSWLRQHFKLDRYPLGKQIVVDERNEAIDNLVKSLGFDIKDIKPMRRMFVLSKISDNKILLQNDPQYLGRLLQLGGEQLIRAWLAGDWDTIAGAFFTEWSAQKHVVEPCEVPSHLTKIRAMDWGSTSPFSVGWYFVSDGQVTCERDGKPFLIPRGAMVKYREWYGMKPGELNTGLKLTAEEVADGIKERERGEKIDVAVIDPSAFKRDGGPSIAERMGVRGVNWIPADNSRKGGWDQLRSRLKGDGVEPQIYFFKTCYDTIRTVPSLQHDKNKAEDIDTHGEDHAGDETRYACMARPWLKDAPKDLGDLKPVHPTVSELIAQLTKRRTQSEE